MDMFFYLESVGLSYGSEMRGGERLTSVNPTPLLFKKIELIQKMIQKFEKSFLLVCRAYQVKSIDIYKYINMYIYIYIYSYI